MEGAIWYWREDGAQRGPVAWEKLQAMAESGKIAPNDWVFREGWTDWKLACEAKDAAAAEVAQSAPLPPPPPQHALPPLPHMSAAGAPPMAPPMAMGQPGSGYGAVGSPFNPVDTVTVAMGVSAAMPMPMPMGTPMPLPLPPLAPQQTVGDIGPMPPSADGVSDGDVRDLRRVLHDGPEGESAPQWNLMAMAALAASVAGLMFLAFEMGLLAVGLGGWCIYASSEAGNSNGKGMALTAVAIGALNVVFRILCATTDLGLTQM
jgi:hypothetical protein